MILSGSFNARLLFVSISQEVIDKQEALTFAFPKLPIFRK